MPAARKQALHVRTHLLQGLRHPWPPRRQFNEDIAYRIGRAYAQLLDATCIVVGGDMRLSTEGLNQALANGLMDAGCDGNFPNGIPNPILPENRLVTTEAVKAHNADMGISWAGDFDRCVLSDESGEFIKAATSSACLPKPS